MMRGAARAAGARLADAGRGARGPGARTATVAATR